ncbi:hypothetical protein GCM10027159_03950 [Lysobacter terrae]
MGKISTTILLLVALAAPVALLLLLWQQFHLQPLVAAAIAVATGWALNVAWAFAAQGTVSTDPSPASRNALSIAVYFGWACPVVLVLLTWLVWRLVA